MLRTYTDSTDTVRTRNGVQRLTDNFVKGLKAPPKGNVVRYDDRIRGFGVRVTSAGKKAFVLNYRIHGRERRMTLGSYPAWTLLAARRRAEELRRDVDLGIDPLQRRTDKMNAPTVSDLFERYVSDHLPKKSNSSVINDLQLWNKDILPTLASRKLADVIFSEIDALHRKLTRRAPIQANRAVSLLRKAFNLAMRWGWVTANPAVGIEANPETSRTRYLDDAEIKRLMEALSTGPMQASRDAIYFMLLTGCRRGEAFQAAWDQFDPKFSIWTKPAATTKQRRLHRVPVSSAVSELLERRFQRSTSPFIFASHTGKALTDVKKTWARICVEANLENVRLHDLRHTFASVLVSNGQSLPTIGAMLGHTQTQTTARYAHLFDESLSHAAEIAARAMRV